ncbi:MAG: endo-1,4-beta-xylanase, partial [Defluviitaleaceae bacterium]|nr:endo-1,4-beta-xylanase [Defluviitaleaceae bacterium]
PAPAPSPTPALVAATPPPAPTPEPTPEPVVVHPNSLSFETSADGFSGRGATAARSTAQAHSGDYSMHVTGRTADWQGIITSVPFAEPEMEVEFIVWVKHTESAAVDFALSLEIDGATNPSWRTFDGIASRVLVQPNVWTQMRGTYFLPAAFQTVSVYVETRGSATASFFIDDALVRPAETVFMFNADLTPLHEIWADYFIIGTAVLPRDMVGTRFELVSHHFNAITAANHMKPDALQPTAGSFRWDASDAIVNTTLDNDMHMIGHTLVWHEQSPAWMNPVGISREEAIRNLEAHVTEVVTRYRGQILVWDVVNEAFPSSVPLGNAHNWRANLRQTPWLAAIGYEFIEIAFRAAHAADPYAMLIYNDYNLDSPGKREAVFHMIEELLERGVPIHGVGMQGHYNTGTRPQNVEASIMRFAELGIYVSITELDITVQAALGNERLSEMQEANQARLYAELFRIFRRHSNVIHRVTFWGICDPTSWRSDRFPLLFNADLSEKDALLAVMDPYGFLGIAEKGEIYDWPAPVRRAATGTAPAVTAAATPATPAANVPARPAGVVYSLATDAHIQGLEMGADSTTADILGGTRQLNQAGNPMYTIVENPLGGNAIRVTNRSGDWYAIDLVTANLGMNLANNQYRIVIRGTVASPPAGTHVILGGSSNPWNWLASAEPAANGAFTIDGTISTAAFAAAEGGASQFTTAMRIQTNNTANFTITDITITRSGAAGAAAPAAPTTPAAPQQPAAPAPNIPARPAGVVYSLATDPHVQGLEMGADSTTADILGGSPQLTQAGNPMYTIVTNPLGGNAIRVSNRGGGNWYAVDLVTAQLGMNLAANNYNVVIRGTVENPPAGTMVILGGSSNPWNWLGNAEPGAGGAFTINTTISNAVFAAAEGGAAQFQSAMRIQTNNTATFTITDITITRGGAAAAPAAPQQPATPAANIPARPAGVVYSLSTDPHVQSLAMGADSTTADILGPSANLTQSGNPMYTIVTNPRGGNAVRVSGRGGDWYSIDILTAALNLNLSANSYRVVIHGSVQNAPAGTHVIFGGSSSPWNWLASAEPAANGAFTIDGTISNDAINETDGGAAQFSRAFRLQTNNTATFTVYEIEIRRN